MIGNEREYRITTATIGEFEAVLDRLEERSAERHPLLQQALGESMAGEVQTLREQVAEYDALRGGRVAVLEADSLRALADALIRARIAAGLTQQALAARLGLKEQQVQRYEATRYASANLARLRAAGEEVIRQRHAVDSLFEQGWGRWFPSPNRSVAKLPPKWDEVV